MATTAILVATGRAITANRIAGIGAMPKFVHWGTGTTVPADGNTGLQTPRPEARVEGTVAVVTTVTPNDTYRVVGTLIAGSAAAITEIGIFDSAGAGTPPTGGTLFVRAVFPVINLDIGDALQFTIDTAIRLPV